METSQAHTAGRFMGNQRPGRRLLRQRRLLIGCGLATLLSACGGGSGGSGGVSPIPAPPAAPAPAPTPVPTPVPTPTPPPPPINFDTAEVRRSDGPTFHNAITAWRAGADGTGVTVGVIDSGFSNSSPEFAGRFHPLSTDVTGSGRGFDDNDADNHGTNVAAVILAARNDQNTVGVAWNATLLGLRADRPGSCTDTTVEEDERGCRFADTAIAAGVDRAVQAGARVLNLSLGGSSPGFALRSAVARAAAAGVVIIVSAGNDGDSTDPEDDPANPDPFAAGLLQAAPGAVIIVGASDETGAFGAFSNRAGRDANAYITALGVRVCCSYVDGVLRREDRPTGAVIFTISGTSFAAPQVAGAAALLAQAFPNLTNRQIVDLLLRTARDAGDAGTDATYGRGILDIARAFAPQGATSVAGSDEELALDAPIGGLSGPMGDARRDAQAEAIVLDSYGRAYVADLAQMAMDPLARPQLAPALSGRIRTLSSGSPNLAVTLTVMPDRQTFAMSTLEGATDAQARALAGAAVMRLGDRSRLAFGIARDASAMVAGGADQSAGNFLIADRADAVRLIGLQPAGGTAFATTLGGRGLLIGAMDAGDVLSARRLFDPVARFQVREDERYSRVSIGYMLDRAGLSARTGLSVIDEDRTILGARFSGPLAGRGARTLFADARLLWRPAPDWQLAADWREGWTMARAGGLIAAGPALRSRAWSVELARTALALADDRLVIRVASPLRLTSGALRLRAPVAYDYASLSPTYGLVDFNLAPSGHERVVEAAWSLPVAMGHLTINGYWRTQPDHFAFAEDDVGAALRFAMGF